MRKARPRVIHGIANTSSGSRRECQNHSRFAPCGFIPVCFFFLWPNAGWVLRNRSKFGGLKHQSAQCPSRHRAMNRGAKNPTQRRPSAGAKSGLRRRATSHWPVSQLVCQTVCGLHFAQVHSLFRPSWTNPEQVPKMGWAEEKRLGFAPCAALTRQWARGNAGRARPTAHPAGVAGGAARAG